MWQMMAGMGAGAAGGVLNSVGQQQGFRALAAAKKKQLAEQDAIQAEDSKDLGVTIQNNNPLLMEERHAAQMMQPGQEYLERVRSVGPVGLSVSQQVASAPQQTANMADLQGANERLARLNAADQTETGLRVSKAEFKDRRGGRESKLRRLAELYEVLNMQAAQKGEGLRNLGNMLTAASGAMGGMGGGQGQQPLFTTT